MTEAQLADPWPGRIAPDFLVSGPGDAPVTFYERYCGRPTVVVFAPAAEALAVLGSLADAAQLLGILPRHAAGDPGIPAVALVCSGTLLHAAREVTAGRRYVLLSFLWGDEAEA